jgi:hypothetical protein
MAAAGTPCTDDGEACTADRCNGGGICEHIADGTVCDDGNPCTIDSCDPTNGCTNAGVPLPSENCDIGGRSKLALTDGVQAGADKLRWKWSSGDAIFQDELGTPSIDTTYALCIYDSTDTGPTLVSSIIVAPDPNFWKSNSPNGWRYTDASGSSTGVQKVLIGTGDVGETKISIQARGDLPLPGALFPDRYFAANPELLVQFASSTGICWQSGYGPAGTTVDNATTFKGNNLH